MRSMTDGRRDVSCVVAFPSDSSAPSQIFVSGIAFVCRLSFSIERNVQGRRCTGPSEPSWSRILNPSDQPVGAPVDATPAPRPERVTLAGRAIILVPLDAEAHADALFDGANGGDKDRVWTYLFDGPYTDRAAFRANIEAKAKSEDPLFFAIVDNASGKAVGYQTLLRIEPQHRVIEVGNILYTPAMQRTIGATEAQYLFARLCLRRARLSPLRMEMQRSQRAVEARGLALRLHFRGRVSPAYDRQGPQSRHGLVFDARQRMAGAARRLRTMARARTISMRRGDRRSRCSALNGRDKS